MLSTRTPLSPRCTAPSVASCGNHGAAPNSGTRVPGNLGGNGSRRNEEIIKLIDSSHPWHPTCIVLRFASSDVASNHGFLQGTHFGASRARRSQSSVSATGRDPNLLPYYSRRAARPLRWPAGRRLLGVLLAGASYHNSRFLTGSSNTCLARIFFIVGMHQLAALDFLSSPRLMHLILPRGRSRPG